MVEMQEMKRIIGVFDAYINSHEADEVISKYEKLGLIESGVFISKELSRRLALPLAAPLSFGDLRRKAIEILNSEKPGNKNILRAIDDLPQGLKGVVRVLLPNDASHVKKMLPIENDQGLYLYLTESWKEVLSGGEKGEFEQLVNRG